MCCDQKFNGSIYYFKLSDLNEMSKFLNISNSEFMYIIKQIDNNNVG